MNLANYKLLWHEQVRNDIEFYQTYEDVFPVFVNWRRQGSPEQLALRLLNDGTTLHYASAPLELSAKFLTWVIEVVDRALKDGKLHRTTSHSSFPANRGKALRSRAYAKALLTGEFALADAKQALEDLMENIEQLEVLVREENHYWEDMEEADLLAPARLALILGDLDRFDELLPYPRKFKWHKLEADLLIDVAEAARQDQPPSEELTDRFVRYFEEVRPPIPIQVEREKREHGGTIYGERDLRRFEIGVLYCQYIDTSEPFSWQRAIHEISK